MASGIHTIADLDPNGTYTYADYLTWQFGELVELVRGKLMRRMSPAPTDRHQAAVGEFHLLIGNYLRRKRCKVRIAPYDVRLTTKGANAADESITTVVQPDLCVICDVAKIDLRGCLGAPDWIIEVLSPGTAAYDWKNKFDLYEETGVGEYWIVDPLGQSIAVFVRDAATGRYQTIGDFAAPGAVPSHTLPELALDWADVFPAE